MLNLCKESQHNLQAQIVDRELGLIALQLDPHRMPQSAVENRLEELVAELANGGAKRQQQVEVVWSVKLNHAVELAYNLHALWWYPLLKLGRIGVEKVLVQGAKLSKGFRLMEARNGSIQLFVISYDRELL